MTVAGHLAMPHTSKPRRLGRQIWVGVLELGGELAHPSLDAGGGGGRRAAASQGTSLYLAGVQHRVPPAAARLGADHQVAIGAECVCQ